MHAHIWNLRGAPKGFSSRRRCVQLCVCVVYGKGYEKHHVLIDRRCDWGILKEWLEFPVKKRHFGEPQFYAVKELPDETLFSQKWWLMILHRSVVFFFFRLNLWRSSNALKYWVVFNTFNTFWVEASQFINQWFVCIYPTMGWKQPSIF